MTFVDGLGRVLQQKREIEIDRGPDATEFGWTVSGALTRDAIGRVTHVGQPRNDAITPALQVSPAFMLNPTQLAYDAFDRVTTVTEANGIDQTNYTRDYQVHLGQLGPHETVQTSRVANPNATRTVESFFDMEGNLLMLRQNNIIAGMLTPVETSYGFDLQNRRILVHDAAGIDTTAAYDSFGRMTELMDPDSGSTQYEYTLGGDLGARRTGNLPADATKIRYVHDHHRLTTVDYPSGTDVQYTYGANGAAFFGGGRVVRVDDRSGQQEFRYGFGGEVTRVDRTLRSFAWSTTSAEPETASPASTSSPLAMTYMVVNAGWCTATTLRRSTRLIPSSNACAISKQSLAER